MTLTVALSIRRLLAGLAVAFVLAGCQHEERRSFQGFAEGETVRMAVPASGNLSRLTVTPGARVTEGTQLFSVAEDDELSAYREASRRLQEAQRAGKTGRKGDAALESLRAQVAEAEWKLAQKTARAPVDGVVTQTLYASGDWVPAGAPVVAILPVDKIKVRFLVPLSVASHLQHGRGVTLLCASCGDAVEATVTYVSPFAQPGDGADGIEALRYAVEAKPVAGQEGRLEPGRAVTVIL